MRDAASKVLRRGLPGRVDCVSLDCRVLEGRSRSWNRVGAESGTCQCYVYVNVLYDLAYSIVEQLVALVPKTLHLQVVDNLLCERCGRILTDGFCIASRYVPWLALMIIENADMAC